MSFVLHLFFFNVTSNAQKQIPNKVKKNGLQHRYRKIVKVYWNSLHASNWWQSGKNRKSEKTLKIIDNSTTNGLPANMSFASFDIVNMLPNIYNCKGIHALKIASDNRQMKKPSIQCITKDWKNASVALTRLWSSHCFAIKLLKNTDDKMSEKIILDTTL